jgi:TfoX/Sxy family transcriptional regulator of competence genes
VSLDDELLERVRELVGAEYGVAEKRMFGGVAFLVDGSMAVAVSGQGGLMVRVPPEETDAMLVRPHVSPMVMSGREVRGWIRVSAEGCDGGALLSWVTLGVEHARTLPPT